MKPSTHYTKSGRINIAYQVYGDGPIDLIYVPGWVSNIDLMWRNPQLVSFLTSLAKHARVILFDKRGTGLSDRVTELSILEERMDDIRAVMDAVDSKRAVLFGHSEGGSVSALFAATYPDRTISLITFGVFAKRRYAEDYPWAPTDEERQEVYDMIETSWGSGNMDLAALAPSMAEDSIFMEWLASYFRSGASPSAALALTKMNTQVDIIDILDSISVPTLLLYRTGDIDVKVEEGRFISERIKGSKFCEFPGNDHLFWVGDSQVVLDEIISFLSSAKQTQVVNKILATILKIEIENGLSDDEHQLGSEVKILFEQFCQIFQKKVTQYRGKVISSSTGLMTASFDGPSKAVHCALDLGRSTRPLKLKIRQGIHTGECEILPNGHIDGEAIGLAKNIQSKAEAGQILVGGTVRNLLSGAGLEFLTHGHIDNPATSRSLEIFSVSEFSELGEEEPLDLKEIAPPENHSFLENVMQSIEQHLNDENYSVSVLCAEMRLSERQLQRKLRSISNKSPNQMIRSVRLHRSKDLLFRSTYDIASIAYQTGFNSISYFSKCFKKEFGVTPSEVQNPSSHVLD